MFKIIALISMTIDHIGLISLNNNFYFRFIGRLAFPMFAYLLAYNYINRTSDKTLFLKRLFIFALISEPFYIYAFNVFKLNIFFTFTLGIILYEFIKRKNIFYILLTLFLAFFTDYSLIGVLLISYFLYRFENKVDFRIDFLILFVLLYLLNSINYFLTIPIILLFLYNFEKIENYKQETFKNINKKFKYFFYFYYPFHILIIKLLSWKIKKG